MKKDQTVITVSQLFIILFISRIIVNMTYNPMMSGEQNMWDHVISSIISFIIIFPIILPIYKICTKYNNTNLLDISYILLGKLGSIVCIIYALYYLFISIYTLSIFKNFIYNAMNPQLSLVAISILLILVCCYAAFKGIEGLVRASSLILVLIIISFILITIALIPKINSNNYEPFLYDGPRQAIAGVFLMISRSSCVPALAILLPLAKKGNLKKGIVFWNIGVYSLTIIIITIVVGSLGSYLKTQSFPIYTATCIAEIGIFKQLDAFYIGMWITGIFIKISLFLYLFSECIKKICNEKIAKISIVIGGMIIGFISLIFSVSPLFLSILYNLKINFVLMILTSIIIPVILLTINFVKHKGRS